MYAINTKPKYTASLNFVLSNSTSSAGGLMGFANQFGLNLGDGDDDVFSGDNIITLMKSRRMVQQALFLTMPGSSKSLLNTFITDNKINEGWQKNYKN